MLGPRHPFKHRSSVLSSSLKFRHKLFEVSTYQLPYCMHIHRNYLTCEVNEDNSASSGMVASGAGDVPDSPRANDLVGISSEVGLEFGGMESALRK